ncbi:hypothetical protein EOA16_27580 [Mesorhizobium sp. M7A.F.Ca.US.008.03.1.1]|nr:hypothetical protein EOA16_27580 [Mesorhizobium sp. M7A.F.Ca.US.008.03.1.1]
MEGGIYPAFLLSGRSRRYSVLLPVSIRGEVPGRAMRGSADASRLSFLKPSTKLPEAGAAPHLAAVIFSPYRDGEKDAFAGAFANRRRAHPTQSIGTCPGSASTRPSQAATAG